MAYKDKDRQREANKQASQRRRDKVKGMTQGMTVKDEPSNVIPSGFVIPVDVKLANLNGEPIITKPELTAQGNIRVSKPGDDDYVPQCETTKAFIDGRDKRPEPGKRGKDIKTFEDLPPDVQQTIDSLSMVDGRICQRVKANRTAIAINYQHLFPDRYYSTGVA